MGNAPSGTHSRSPVSGGDQPLVVRPPQSLSKYKTRRWLGGVLVCAGVLIALAGIIVMGCMPFAMQISDMLLLLFAGGVCGAAGFALLLWGCLSEPGISNLRAFGVVGGIALVAWIVLKSAWFLYGDMGMGMARLGIDVCLWQLRSAEVEPAEEPEPVFGADAKPDTPSPDGMAWIPGGEFMMGCVPPVAEDEMVGDQCGTDEKPRHRVVVNSFYLDVYEVTQGEYARETGKNPSSFAACGADCPVEMVTWAEAMSFCEKVDKRLPTEAEWEFAARGGVDGKKYFWGNGSRCHPGGPKFEANFCDLNCTERGRDPSCDDGYEYTAPVGQYPPNGYGLYDMGGNVWEWTADIYSAKYYEDSPTNNPNGPRESNYRSVANVFRVVRGGGWLDPVEYLRISNRLDVYNSDGTTFTGFRCARNQ